jgi:hypothetical protein
MLGRILRDCHMFWPNWELERHGRSMGSPSMHASLNHSLPMMSLGHGPGWRWWWCSTATKRCRRLFLEHSPTHSEKTDSRVGQGLRCNAKYRRIESTTRYGARKSVCWTTFQFNFLCLQCKLTVTFMATYKARRHQRLRW